MIVKPNVTFKLHETPKFKESTVNMFFYIEPIFVMDWGLVYMLLSFSCKNCMNLNVEHSRQGYISIYIYIFNMFCSSFEERVF